jgi:hypothetical protein
MVGTAEGRGWVGKSDRGSDIKGPGCGRFNRNPPYMTFPAAADLESASLNYAAPLAATFHLAVSVEFHPMDVSARTQER